MGAGRGAGFIFLPWRPQAGWREGGLRARERGGGWARLSSVTRAQWGQGPRGGLSEGAQGICAFPGPCLGTFPGRLQGLAFCVRHVGLALPSEPEKQQQ